jgi:hypothetical protein
MLDLRVKTPDRRSRRWRRGASLPSWGIVVELFSTRSRSGVIGASFGSSYYLLFILDLLCKRVSSSPCIGSVVCGFIYKTGQNPISREQEVFISGFKLINLKMLGY